MHLDSDGGILEHHQKMCREFHPVTSRSQLGQLSNHSPAMALPVCQPVTWQTIVLTRLPDKTWTDCYQSAVKKSHQVDEITASKRHKVQTVASVTVLYND